MPMHPNTETGINIFGLAICQYEHSATVYRFSCSQNWETENDSDFDSIEDAMNTESSQYDISKIHWIQYHYM